MTLPQFQSLLLHRDLVAELPSSVRRAPRAASRGTRSRPRSLRIASTRVACFRRKMPENPVEIGQALVIIIRVAHALDRLARSRTRRT